MQKNSRLQVSQVPQPQRLGTRVVGSVVEWMNPRTMRWEAISDFGSSEAAMKAAAWYSNQELKGW